MALNVALIGFGLSGRQLIAPFLHFNENFNLKKVLTRNEVKERYFYYYVSFTNNFDEILNEDIDLVFITSPNYNHYEQAIRLMEAGKDIVVEKPVTPTKREAEELKQIAYEYNCKIVAYHNRRWDSCFKTVSRVLSEGYLGELKEFEATWERYEPNVKQNWWRDEPGPGTGVLYDLGPHLIDQAIQLFGMPSSLFADIRFMRPDSKVDDYFDINLFYDGLKVRLRSGVYMRQSVARYIVHGTRGSFIKKNIDPQGTQLTTGILPDMPEFGVDNEMCLINTGDSDFISSENSTWMIFFNILYNHFVNDSPPPVSIDDAIAVADIIEKSFISNKERRVINL